MKKLTALVLAGCMALSLAACGETKEEPAAASSSAASSSEASAVSESSSASEASSASSEAAVPTTNGVTITACIASEPETIDPNMFDTVDAGNYSVHLFETLLRRDTGEEEVVEGSRIYGTRIVPGQAESFDVSDDNLVWTFHLRDGIKWSDGKPVTAQDFEYSWRRIVDPATASPYGYILNGIVKNAEAINNGEMDPTELGAKALDEKTFEVTLENPCAYFEEIAVFAQLAPLRQDVIEANENWTEPGVMISNGAFVLTEWVHDSYIKMEKNPEYYNIDRIVPDTVIFYLSDSTTAIYSSFQSGEYDYIDEFPTDLIASLVESGDASITPKMGTYFLYLNTETISDWRVRAAMSLAIDRDNLVENVTKGGQAPATGFVSAGITDSAYNDFKDHYILGSMYDSLVKEYPDYDLESYTGRCELAQDLFQEAVDEGKWDPNKTLQYNYNTSESNKAIAEACCSDWESVLGISTTLANQEWGTYEVDLEEGNFDIARMGWLPDFNDATSLIEMHVTGNSYNYESYSNADYDEHVKQAKALAAGEERDNHLYAAEEILFQPGGFPIAPLYYYTQFQCMSKNVDSVGIDSMGMMYFHRATKN